MDKLTWNAQKKELWKMPIEELEEKLNQLERQLMKDNVRCGSSGKRVANTKESHVDLKGLRHKIACIKTIIKQKK